MDQGGEADLQPHADVSAPWAPLSDVPVPMLEVLPSALVVSPAPSVVEAVAFVVSAVSPVVVAVVSESAPVEDSDGSPLVSEASCARRTRSSSSTVVSASPSVSNTACTAIDMAPPNATPAKASGSALCLPAASTSSPRDGTIQGPPSRETRQPNAAPASTVAVGISDWIDSPGVGRPKAGVSIVETPGSNRDCSSESGTTEIAALEEAR